MTTLHQFRDKATRDLEVIKNAYWIINLGPGGGDAEGYIVAQGTPEEVARAERSFTGRPLKNVLHVEWKHP
jgi:excinuclease ABC subunit A